MKRFSNILLVADGDCWAEAPLQRAVALAKHNQARLSIVQTVDIAASVRPEEKGAYERLKNGVVEAREKQLRHILAVAGKEITLSIRVLQGKVFPEVVREVLRHDHDLVMKCAQQSSGLREKIFGSTDMHLLRKCPCPVWIMKPGERKQYRRILAAVDTEDSRGQGQTDGLNQQILELASSLALSEFSELHIVHAWQAWGEGLLSTPRFVLDEDDEVAAWVEKQRTDEKERVDGLMKSLGEIIGRETMEYLKPKIHNIKGEAQDVIPTLAEEIKADIVIMGTVARTGIPGLIMGNTAESILTGIGCSVLAVKPRGFVSPITLSGG